MHAEGVQRLPPLPGVRVWQGQATEGRVQENAQGETEMASLFYFSSPPPTPPHHTCTTSVAPPSASPLRGGYRNSGRGGGPT